MLQMLETKLPLERKWTSTFDKRFLQKQAVFSPFTNPLLLESLTMEVQLDPKLFTSKLYLKNWARNNHQSISQAVLTTPMPPCLIAIPTYPGVKRANNF